MSQGAIGFDEVDSNSGLSTGGGARKAFWEVDQKDEQKLLQWLNDTLKELEQHNQDRLHKIRRNVQLLRGIQYREQIVAPHERGNRPDSATAHKTPKIVSNLLHDLADTKISRAVKYKPAVAILPTNDEWEDKVAANTVKACIDHVWYENKYQDRIKPKIEKIRTAMGEAYLFILWNPDRGDLHPDWKKAEELARIKKEEVKVPLLDEDKQPVLDEKGNPRYIDRPVRVGDVEYIPELATNVLFERCDSFEDAHYLFWRRFRRIGELRARYPKHKDKLQTGNARRYNWEKQTEEVDPNWVEEWNFFFRRNEYLEKGAHIVFTRDILLDKNPCPFDHRELPCERITDIDYPGDPYGESFIEQVKGITMMFNNLNNMVIRNLLLVSHPKWMVPLGSAKKSQLGNTITIVEYKGAVAPQLVQAEPVPASLFKHLETLKQLAIQGAGHSSVSRGEPPPGVTAGVALMFLDEKENERQNLAILKTNEFDRNVVIKTISLIGTYYDENDGRTMRIMGKNRQWESVVFREAHLSKSYDVRVQNTSALPESKAARTSFLLELHEKFPGKVTDEQVLELLDVAQSDKFLDIATVSIRAAEAENQTMLEEPVDVEEHEDHIQHWTVHARDIQEWGFKVHTPQDVRERKIDHARAHEYFMLEKARKYPHYAEKLAALEGFPMFFDSESALQRDAEREAAAAEAEAQAMAAEMGGGAGSLPPEALESQLPVNPDLGGEPGLPVNPPEGAAPALPPNPGALDLNREI